MASQQDLQELLRLLTAGKVSIKDAMARVKALQAADLRSIHQIAEAPLSAVEAAIEDKKAARSLHNACKARLKNPNPSASSKRAGAELLRAAKRPRDGDIFNGPQPISPHELEASLELPIETDEGVIAQTTLATNRAPIVLAFAVELLRYTMPDQPPSSRLSLAQAVVSANSRSKAVAIGLATGPSADEEGWGHGQPRVRVMGREITVLKRGGYEWKGDEETDETKATQNSTTSTATVSEEVKKEPQSSAATTTTTTENEPKTWSASRPVTVKESTFIVRAIDFTAPSKRQATIQALFSAVPSLQSASHNVWAYRVQLKPNVFGYSTIKEESFDDGESGGGEFLLKTLRESEVVNTLVVLSRWYGGIMLGPDRWRIMRNCLKEALAERLRVSGEQTNLGGEALWGLDLEAMKNKSAVGDSSTRSYEAGVVGMPIHRPEAARSYLFKSFATRVEAGENPHAGSEDAEGEDGPAKAGPKKRTQKSLELEKQENLGRLLGAIRLVYDSWADHLSANELDRRAWSWYTAVRPGGDHSFGWGEKGHLKLADILALRRKNE